MLPRTVVTEGECSCILLQIGCRISYEENIPSPCKLVVQYPMHILVVGDRQASCCRPSKVEGLTVDSPFT